MQYSFDDPISRSGDLTGGFVGLYLSEDLAPLNLVTGPDLPFHDSTFDDTFAELRHDHLRIRSGHGAG